MNGPSASYNAQPQIRKAVAVLHGDNGNHIACAHLLNEPTHLLVPQRAESDYFFPRSERMCATRELTCSALSEFLNGGIPALPSEMICASCASGSFWTSGERRFGMCMLFPTSEPLPSGPWHMAHFVR